MASTWAARLFGSAPKGVRRAFTDEGVVIAVDASLPDAQEISAATVIGLLTQFNDDGRLTDMGNGQLLLPWAEVYEILDTPDGAAELSALSLPGIHALYPRLISEGSLTSEDFSVGVNGWREGESRNRDDITCAGALANLGDAQVLMPKGSYRVMMKLREFFSTDSRTPEFNRAFWGSLRQEAVAAGAVLDDFLYSTVVLTPDKLTSRAPALEGRGRECCGGGTVVRRRTAKLDSDF